MSEQPHDPSIVHRALGLIDDAIARNEAEMSAMPHVALIFDPDDGTYQALGPYIDGPTAMLAAQQQADQINQGFEAGDTPVVPHVALFHDITRQED